MLCGSILVSRTLRGGPLYSPDLFCNLGERVLLQVTRIAVEFTNAFGELLCSHCVFVVHPAECLFIQMEAFFLDGLCFCWIEFTIESSLGFLQLVEKIRADREQVASRQADDLIHIPEAGAHHLSLVVVFLVIVVDARHRCNSGVLVGLNLLSPSFFLIPIVNATDEGRDQGHSRLGACDRLSETKKECQIAVNTFFFQTLS